VAWGWLFLASLISCVVEKQRYWVISGSGSTSWNERLSTNAVEAVHRQFRKLTKTKGGFANENSLLKLLYAGILKASERWTHPVQNWNLTLSQLAIHFEGRLDKHIAL
jgi:transposase-like protein